MPGNQLEHVLNHPAASLLQESRRFEHQIARLSLTSRDCAALMPGEQPAEQARIEHLQQEHKVLEEELVEAEAKNRLYTLLGERTRWAGGVQVLHIRGP